MQAAFDNLQSSLVASAGALQSLQPLSLARGNQPLQIQNCKGSAPVALAANTVVKVGVKLLSGLKGPFLACSDALVPVGGAVGLFTGTLPLNTPEMRLLMHADPTDPVAETPSLDSLVLFLFYKQPADTDWTQSQLVTLTVTAPGYNGDEAIAPSPNPGYTAAQVAAAITQAAAAEPNLGKPAQNGLFLSSTTDGVRSWKSASGIANVAGLVFFATAGGAPSTATPAEVATALQGADAVLNTVRVTGSYAENTTLPGTYLGYQNGPRMMFANGNAAQNWQIDNNGGEFRWYTPGTERMTLSPTGELFLKTGGLTSIGNIVALGSVSFTNGLYNLSSGEEVIDLDGNLSLQGSATIRGGATVGSLYNYNTGNTIVASNGAFYYPNGGVFVTPDGTILYSTGDALVDNEGNLYAPAGLGIFGAAPPLQPGPIADLPANATNAQIAAAFNEFKAAMIAYGFLAQN